MYPHLTWTGLVQGVAEELPFADASFDAIGELMTDPPVLLTHIYQPYCINPTPLC